MDATAEGDWCGLFSCVCRWPLQCSSRIPHVSPGYDYLSLPADEDGQRPAWSLLVGFSDGAKLRLHRLRVAQSGRILGRSDDALEIFHDLGKLVLDASASVAPDGGSLCVLHQDYETPPQALRLQLLHAEEVDGRITKEELPPLPMDPEVPCCPISAAGHMWAPCTKFLFESGEFSIVMLRLQIEDTGGGQSRWEQVGERVVGPDNDDIINPWGGRFLQGCTVLPLCGGSRTLILVSLRQCGLFFTFDCSTSVWTQVNTSEATPESFQLDYIPIMGHGVYIQEDETVYMVRENTIYAYKLHYDEDHHRLKLELPVKICSVCPFMSETGYGFLAHLGSRLMCSVWISVGLRCSCKNLHAIVTTFQLPAQGEIKVLHSTCRRIDMLPSMPNLHTHEFCFLQEFKEFKDEELSHSPISSLSRGKKKGVPISSLSRGEKKRVPISSLSQGKKKEVPISCYPITSAPLVLECCRRNFLPNYCPPSPVVHVKPAIQYVKPDLFIICQAGTQSVVYKTNVIHDSGRLIRDDGKLLKQFASIPDDDCHYMLEEQSCPSWFFLRGRSCLYSVSGIKDGRYVFGFGKEVPGFDPLHERTTTQTLVMAIRVGIMTIALTGTLEVFKQTRSRSKTQSIWLPYHIDRSDVPNKKVKLCGYAVLDDYSFIVCDAITNSCFLFDLNVKQCRIVMTYAKLKFRVSHLVRPFPRRCVLNGTSVFVDGFIYTCVDGGLDAYELLKDCDTVFLSEPIFLPLSLDIVWENERMCLDYGGKDTSGGIIFFVVQGGFPPTWPKHHVRIITVHVNTEKTLSNKMKPVKIGHLDCVTRSVEHEKGVVRLSARNCFAFSSLRKR